MSEPDASHCRYFLSYRGVSLPLTLVTELQPAQLEHRNTYFCGWFDSDDRLVRLQKRVYGEIELEHRYAYHPDGSLQRAEITDADGEITALEFDRA